ncbi:glutathione S-transferase [Bradyrhizobium sp. LM3.2]
MRTFCMRTFLHKGLGAIAHRSPRQIPLSPAPKETLREDDVQGQKLTIWGRANSVNVQKVLWCLTELSLPYERIDAGMAFGKTREADYLAMNPNARIPTLVEGDFALWESNSIMRYLCLAHGRSTPIYPEAPKLRASVDRWLDWTLSIVQPVDRPVFWGIVRTPPAERDMIRVQQDADAAAEVWAIADHLLATRPFMDGDIFTLARHRDRRLCAALARRRGHHPARAAASDALARRTRQAARFCAICGPADVVSR